jgi:hypothetical protein
LTIIDEFEGFLDVFLGISGFIKRIIEGRERRNELTIKPKNEHLIYQI